MRTIRWTKQFKKDFKREQRGQHGPRLATDLEAVTLLLAQDQILPQRLRDHPLSNNWSDHRDLHLRPDLVVIYRKSDENSLEFVRLGSHSELGL